MQISALTFAGIFAGEIMPEHRPCRIAANEYDWNIRRCIDFLKQKRFPEASWKNSYDIETS